MPWVDDFGKVFCAECGRDDCDSAGCPHIKEWDKPVAWWLGQKCEEGREHEAK
ncbi:MAG: hypothetical protein NC131_10745 [Roseburia sp.]|nr:hypothetical protein [Roseburia sp.]